MTQPGIVDLTQPYIMGDTLMGDKEWEIQQGSPNGFAQKAGQSPPKKKGLPPTPPPNFSGDLTNPVATATKEDGKEAEGMATIKDLLAKGGKAGKPKSLTASQKSATLASVWQENMGEITGAYQPPMTEQAKGQLSKFAKACPPGEAVTILSRVMRDWLLFATSVKGSAGLNQIPSDPHVGFLLKYVAEAIAFAKPPKTQAQVFVPKTPAAAPAPAPAGPKKMTPEELAAIMSGEYDGEDDE